MALLAAGMVLSLFFREWQQAAAIGIVLLINTAIGYPHRAQGAPLDGGAARLGAGLRGFGAMDSPRWSTPRIWFPGMWCCWMPAMWSPPI